MKYFLRQFLRWITWILIILAIVFWIVTVLGWLVTDPSFELANVVVSAILTVLAVLLRSLNKSWNKLKFSVLSTDVGMSSGGIELKDGKFALSKQLVLSLHSKVCVHNFGNPTSLMFFISSIGPKSLSSCLSEDLLPKDINVEIKSRKQPNWAAVELGNPFVAETGDKNIEVRVIIPLSVREIEKSFGALASLENFTVALKIHAEGLGSKITLKPFTLNLLPIHNRIENDIASQIPKYPVRSNQPVDTQQLVYVMKRYWVGEKK